MRSGVAMWLVAVVVAALAVPAGGRASAADGLSLRSNAAMETVRGTARTAALPDGGFLQVHAFGAVSRRSADGRTVWQRDSGGLYRDWGLRWQQPSFVSTPQLAWGSNPVNPLQFSGAGTGLVDDTAPYTVGDLSQDGVPDVAVAETVGVNMTSQSACQPLCRSPFDVTGSDLHLGTFVTVLDGRSGRTLYDELEPGYVTQLAIAGGRLLVGDETGDPQHRGDIGQWNSVSTVRALSFDRSGQGLAAHRDWSYSTGAPWARLFGVAAVGSGVAVSWSDTPLGLGTPGPPDGHVVLLDAGTGARRWDARTAGYPSLLAADPRRSQVVAVQLTDPNRSVGYTVTGLRVADGRTAVSVARDGAVPTSLAVGQVAGDRPDWVVGAVDAKVADGYQPVAGRVSSVDPDHARERWSAELPALGPARVPQPGGLVLANGSVVVGSWTGAEAPTASTPRTETDSLVSLSGTDGRQRWRRVGDIGDPLSLSAAGGLVRAVTDNQVVEAYNPAGDARLVAAEPGDLLGTVAAPTSDPERTDLVAGDESGAVYAFDGDDLAPGSTGPPRVLWQTVLPGPVHQIVRARVDGKDALVAAATGAVGVLDPATGHLRLLIQVPDTYVWTVTVGTAGSEPVVVVPGGALTAYSLRSGRTVWRYQAPAGAYVSDAVFADGVFAAEYSSPQVGGASAASMAAVGVDSATGHAAWTVPADPATTRRGQLWNGAVADAAIPGVGGHGVALAWETANGQGRVEVRDARTGELAYSDTDSALDQHTGYLTDPSLGLVAVSQYGAVRVTPDGPRTSTQASGMSLALLHSGAGSALLAASAFTYAFPTDIFGGSGGALDIASVFNDGNLLTADFGGGDVAVSTPSDWNAFRIVNGEVGHTVLAYRETLQHGLAVFSLAPGTASAVPNRKPPAYAATPAAPSPEPDRTGRARPLSVVQPRDGGVAAATPSGYSPSRIRAYLGPRGDGSGQTIAIVDAYDDPRIAADVEEFSEQYGLPGVCGAGGDAGNCFELDVAHPDGTAGTDASWSLETALDVEWAHAVAPKAKLRLVEAHDAGFAAMFRAVDAATATRPAAVSMSWGLPFEFSDETYYDGHCAVTTTVCAVSSGDDGHPGSYPAYNPAALAVGGTSLTLAADDSVSSETAWSGSGGGRSFVEPGPPYQRALPDSDRRQIPDVAFDADPATGVAVYDSVTYRGQAGWFQVGGTSLSAPVWAAILADADQLRAGAGGTPLTAGAAQRAVYDLPPGTLADITGGPANGFCPVGCAAGTGYDEVTGLGSPRHGLDQALAAADPPADG